jgi:lipoprotein-anchoring transpeptidase ErfK/SrfK
MTPHRHRQPPQRASGPRRAGILLVAVAVGAAATVAGLVLLGCGSSSPATTAAGTTSAPSTPTTPTLSPTTTLPPGYIVIATAARPQIEVFAASGDATPVHVFDNPWFVNDDPAAPVPLVFLAEDQRTEGWVQVMLPIRPNGSTGWVRAGDVTLAPSSYHITITLSAHRLVVYDGTDVLAEDTVAIGARATPTPSGRFYIRALLQAPNPNTTYGPYAYGLSGHSETLQEFAGGDAEVGIHGNNDASVLGKDVSHGCIRMSNDLITHLTTFIPLGTLVEIKP